MKVIAEIGSNWKSIEDCTESIRIAADCGADAVKFQLYTHKELFGTEGQLAGEMPAEWLPRLHATAANYDIEFMCTAFSPGGYRYIDSMVQTHKVASAELTHRDILETVNTFRKPVILSTGGSSVTEIEDALSWLTSCPVTLMFCVADYPAKIIDFRKLSQLRQHFGGRCKYGYSDHSIDVLNIPFMAKLRGCEVIEKHVNFAWESNTPDAGHSLTEAEFRLMVKNLKVVTHLDETEELCNQDMRGRWKRKFMELPSGEAGYFRTK